MYTYDNIDKINSVKVYCVKLVNNKIFNNYCTYNIIINFLTFKLIYSYKLKHFYYLNRSTCK